MLNKEEIGELIDKPRYTAYFQNKFPKEQKLSKVSLNDMTGSLTDRAMRNSSSLPAIGKRVSYKFKPVKKNLHLRSNLLQVKSGVVSEKIWKVSGISVKNKLNSSPPTGGGFYLHQKRVNNCFFKNIGSFSDPLNRNN